MTRPFAALPAVVTSPPAAPPPPAAGVEWFGNDAQLLQHCWHPVLPSRSLGVEPVAVDVGGQPWVIVRLGDGLAAYPDLCPHRRVPLSRGIVVGDELVCGYHGWRFAPSGRCTAIPALGLGAPVPKGMAAQPAGGVRERDGFIWLAPRAPIVAAPELPIVAGRELVWGACPPRRTSASIGILMDNFLDVAHFSYLHSNSIGVTVPVVVDDFDVSTSGAVLTACHEATVDQAGGQATRVARYTLRGPTVLELDLDFPAANHRSFIVFWMHASGAAETVVHKLVGWPADDATALAEQVDLEVRILEEDLSMVELIKDPRLPLALRAEQHTRADRAGVALRRMISEQSQLVLVR